MGGCCKQAVILSAPIIVSRLQADGLGQAATQGGLDKAYKMPLKRFFEKTFKGLLKAMPFK